MKKAIVSLFSLSMAAALLASMAQAQTKPAASSTRAQIGASVQKALAYLRKTQGPDGAWQIEIPGRGTRVGYPGITAVAVLGFLRNVVTDKDPAVAKACEYLARLAKPNGAIYAEQFGPQGLPNYNTALSLTALNATHNPKYAQIIKKAQQFLSTSQFDEGEGFKPADRQYGGIGYGSREDNPDLSNLQNSLEALRESGYPKNAEVFKKALIFIQRCQNRSESNDQPWAGTDGGFIYAASGESKADEYTKQAHSSYGSMTYAGLKSYLYCSVSKTDPRVQAAWNWLKANYDTEQNPRMGLDGLYYYYHTMSKTLAVWGDRAPTMGGKKRAWGPELAAAIIKRQRPDGSWVNSNPRWWEDRADLATGYALVSLANCKAGL